MTSKTSSLSLAALGVVACASAQAGPVTVTQSFSLSTLIQGSGSPLSFDLNSFLTGQGMSAANVVSGQVVVHGFSEASYLQNYSSYGGYSQIGSSSHQASYSYYVPGYSCSWCWSYNPGYTQYVNYWIDDSIESRYIDNKHVDNVADEMRVRVGNTTGSDTADQHSSSATGYGGYNYEGQSVRYYDGNGNASYTTRYNRQQDVYEAVYGALDTAVSFDTAALLDLRSDGVLGMDIGAVGQFRLTSVDFTLAVDNDIPEPGGLALAGVALAGVIAVSRRKRKKAL